MRQKKYFVFLALVLLILSVGCTQGNNNPSDANKTTDENKFDPLASQAFVGDTVKVEYEGSFPDGNVFDKSAPGKPLEFVLGAGQLIKGFEAAVIGMKLNKQKTITLEPKDAYGEYDPDLIWSISTKELNDVMIKPKIGMILKVEGRPGTVIATDENITKVDMNPALAGKTLVFKIKLVGITKAKK
ncbi:MAG: peptidylprolyl isomerase [Candidatus Diapherotrites archaeon]